MSLQTNISNAYGKSVETKINLEKEFIQGEMKNKNLNMDIYFYT